MNESPSFKANQFANNAEDYTRAGDYPNACTSHFRAAEQYLLAMNDTKDPEVSDWNRSDVKAVKTLKLLYASHTRNGKDLQRRLNSQVGHEISSAGGTGISASSGEGSKRAVHLYSGNQPTVIQTGPTESMMAGSRQFFVGQTTQHNTPDPPQSSTLTSPVRKSSLDTSSSIAQSYLILDGDAHEIRPVILR